MTTSAPTRLHRCHHEQSQPLFLSHGHSRLLRLLSQWTAPQISFVGSQTFALMALYGPTTRFQIGLSLPSRHSSTNTSRQEKHACPACTQSGSCSKLASRRAAHSHLLLRQIGKYRWHRRVKHHEDGHTPISLSPQEGTDLTLPFAAMPQHPVGANFPFHQPLKLHILTQTFVPIARIPQRRNVDRAGAPTGQSRCNCRRQALHSSLCNQHLRDTSPEFHRQRTKRWEGSPV
mmetsp:Transcript_1168/g.3147  ORF Transcript_1168/g.3147 Transcript_1168/m.3147 type:complete len:232 (-) Transcript_1168:233-928(-)